ncbi:sugar transferase [Kocuria arenosa]|uniref:sugar transferase n=1 Tax=Kocuria arenosa TaxID=3071446 RepID=UPI0034D4213B
MLQKNTAHLPAAWRDVYVSRVRIVDAAVIAITVAVAQLLRFGFGSGELKFETFAVPYWCVGVILGVAWWVWLELRGARDERLIGYGVEETKYVVSATLVLFGAVAIVSYTLDIPTARGYVVLALPLGVTLLLLGRGQLRRLLVRRRRHGFSMSRTLIVGRYPGAVEIIKSVQAQAGSGIDPVAMYVPPTTREWFIPPADVPLPPNELRSGEDPSVAGIVAACREHRIESVILCSNSPLSTAEIRHLSWYLADEHVRLIMDTGLTDVAGPRIHAQLMAGLPLIHVSTPRMTRARLLSKRVMDILGAVAALILLTPAMLALAIAVRMHDGGPAIFAQERVGMDGRRFRMLKFRSMYCDAEARKAALLTANESNSGVLFHMKNDPRVTSPGQWMRRHSLDELPQFWNVLKGEMSLVGPRPPLPSEVALYEDHVHRRLRVKPGMTGLWQVSGRHGLDWDQTVRLDLYYVENWSPVQDVVILMRTVNAVIAQNDAAPRRQTRRESAHRRAGRTARPEAFARSSVPLSDDSVAR